jgi:hypothetical protein
MSYYLWGKIRLHRHVLRLSFFYRPDAMMRLGKLNASLAKGAEKCAGDKKRSIAWRTADQLKPRFL